MAGSLSPCALWPCPRLDTQNVAMASWWHAPKSTNRPLSHQYPLPQSHHHNPLTYIPKIQASIIIAKMKGSQNTNPAWGVVHPVPGNRETHSMNCLAAGPAHFLVDNKRLASRSSRSQSERGTMPVSFVTVRIVFWFRVITGCQRLPL